MLNPILERELKSKMRSWKMPISIFIYLFFIGLITYLGMMMFFTENSRGFNPRTAANIYDFICIFQLLIIMFIVPLITATTISGERERQTLDLMLCTDIPSMSIIYGKIFSQLSTILLLVIMATPFMSVSFILGGIGFFDVLKIILYYIASSFCIACISIYSSTKFRKNITAIIMTYVIMAIIYIVPFIFLMTLTISIKPIINIHDESYIISSILFGPNPGYGIISLITNNSIVDVLSSKAMPYITKIPTWIISVIWFGIISSITLVLANKNLKKKL